MKEVAVHIITIEIIKCAKISMPLLCSSFCVFVSSGLFIPKKNEDDINDNQIVDYFQKIVIMLTVTEHPTMFLAVSCIVVY